MTMTKRTKAAYVSMFMAITPRTVAFLGAVLLRFFVFRGVRLTLCGVNEYIVCMTIYAPALVRGEGPLYVELADAIERDIAAGALAPGERLPTHRDLADALQLNVSTVTRGYREAEKRGLVSATVGRGTFVTSDAVTNSAMVSFEPSAPGMLELGLIAPLDHLDPEISEGFKRIARRKDPSALLRYSTRAARPNTAGRAHSGPSGSGSRPGAEDVIVCAGSQHALTCALSGLLRSGDRVAVDELTYPGLKTLAGMLGLRLVPIAMDEHGMVPASLDAACRRDEIKALYLMPGVHTPPPFPCPNPGATTSPAWPTSTISSSSRTTPTT